MKKIISFVSSLALVVSMFTAFTTTSYAMEETPANIDVVVDVDEYGYYCVDLLFSVKDTVFDIAVSKTERGTDYYTGTGIFSCEVNYRNLPDGSIYSTSDFILPNGKAENTNVPVYGVTNVVMSVEEVAGNGGGDEISLIKFATDFAEADKTAEEVKEIFSNNFANVIIKTVSVNNVKKGTNITTTDYDDAIGIYGISATGVQHEEATYGITVNATDDGEGDDDDDPVVTEVIPTATATGTVSGVKIGDSYVGDEYDDNGEAADTTESAAVAAGLMGVNGVESTSVLWNVTADGETKSHIQEIAPVSGPATVKVGLVIYGLAQSAIEAVTAVLQ